MIYKEEQKEGESKPTLITLSEKPKDEVLDVEALHKKHNMLTQAIYEDETMLPSRYVFVLTNLCNLRCHFCFQKKDYRKDSMTTEDWINLSKQLPDYSRVTLTGGEPLAFRGFKEVFDYVASRFDVNMISNGLLLTEEIIDFMLSYPKFRALSISIDNIGNTVRDVKPAQWEHLLKMLKYYKQKRDELGTKAHLDVKTTVLDESAGDLFEMYKHFVEVLGCETHSFNFLKGSPIQHADYSFEYDAMFQKSKAEVYKKWGTIKEQLEKVREYNIKNNRKSFLHPNVANLNTEKPIGDQMDFINVHDHVVNDFKPCKFPWSSVHVNVDGIIYPCMAIPVGNVKETPLKDIVHGPEFTRFKKVIRKCGTVEGCNRCGWLIPNKKAES